MSEKQPATRSHEHVLEIQASPGDVWKAITDPVEIARWFALAAEATPGEGGEIVYRWGDFVGRCRILAWEPPRHLRTSWMEAPASPAGQGAALVVDWHVEGAAGKTTLRVVHSGFGTGAEWEREYDGTRRGWIFELQGLKHYLERQRGRERRASWVRQPTTLTPAEVWRRFAQPGTVFRSVALDTLGPGDRYRLVRADGEELTGRVLVNRAPLEFAGTLESHGDGMIRFGFEDCMGQPEAHVWLATWGLGVSEFGEFERGWRNDLQRAFVPHPE
jgi:uncharacterized protein YndB with AHSA1/START domain